MANYLDNTGLSYFLGKLKSLFVANGANVSLLTNDAGYTTPNAVNTLIANAEEVYVGENAPTTGNYKIWIDTDDVPANYVQVGANVSTLVNDAGYANAATVNAIISNGNYTTTTDVENIIANGDFISNGDNVSLLTNDAGYITSGALSGYATTSWVTSQDYVANGDNISKLNNNVGYLTEHQSLANYPTNTQMNAAISNATANMATTTWVTSQDYVANGDNVSLLANDAGYLTQHQSLANYPTFTEMNAAISNAANGKQDTLVSGTNIKTINNQSILGSGNITVNGASIDAYLKTASVSSNGNVLTLYDKDNNQTVFAPDTGNGGGGTTYSAGNGIDITSNTISAKAGNNVTIDANGINATNTTYSNGNGLELSGTTFAVKAGTNITVNASGVHATDTTYSAGNGVTLTGTTFSAKAGTNITVNSNGINAIIPNATSSVVGGLTVRYDSANGALYLRNDGGAA